jgi:hypothetical protein
MVEGEDKDVFLSQEALGKSALGEAVWVEMTVVDSKLSLGTQRAKWRRALNSLLRTVDHWLSKTQRGQGGQGIILPSKDTYFKARGRFARRNAALIPGRAAYETVVKILEKLGYLSVVPGNKGAAKGLRARILVPTLKLARLVQSAKAISAKSPVLSQGDLEEVLPPVCINSEVGKRRDLSEAEKTHPVVILSTKLVDRLNRHTLSFEWLLLDSRQSLIVPKKTYSGSGMRLRSAFKIYSGQMLVDAAVSYSDLGEPEDNMDAVRLSGKTLRCQRIFSNGSLEFCGRYFSPLQSEVLRQHRRCLLVKFEGQYYPLVEFDYRCLHPRLAYVEEQKKAWPREKVLRLEDPDLYKIPGSLCDRELIKSMLLVLLNIDGSKAKAKSIGALNKEAFLDELLRRAVFIRWKKARTKAINDRLFKESYGLDLGDKDPRLWRLAWTAEETKSCYKDVVSHHKVIAAWFNSGAGPRLMRLESDISSYVLRKMIRAGFPVFNLHDANFTIAHPEATRVLEEAMREGFQKVMGVALDEDGIKREDQAPPPALWKAPT